MTIPDWQRRAINDLQSFGNSVILIDGDGARHIPLNEIEETGMTTLTDKVWELFQRPTPEPTREELHELLSNPVTAAYTLGPEEKCPFCTMGILEPQDPCACGAVVSPPLSFM